MNKALENLMRDKNTARIFLTDGEQLSGLIERVTETCVHLRKGGGDTVYIAINAIVRFYKT